MSKAMDALAALQAQQNSACAKAAGMSEEEWDAHIELQQHEARLAAIPQVDALMAAGWKMQIPDNEYSSEPWQLQWRRPPRRAGSKGMLFLSTNQAHRAMLKEKNANRDDQGRDRARGKARRREGSGSSAAR